MTTKQLVHLALTLMVLGGLVLVASRLTGKTMSAIG